MKQYKSLIKELPSKTVVFAFGRFQPPTSGHAILVNAVRKIAAQQKADHVIFASRSQDKKSNPLPVDRKVYYLEKMFPKTNFVAANDQVRTFIEAATLLSKKYKNVIMIAGSDRVPEYTKILNKYNGDVFKFDTVEVVSAGERDPDSDTASGMSGTKMREAAKKGDYVLFKKGLPHTLLDIDGRRLMNEIRQGLGLEVVKESIKFETNKLREKYHAGKIFNIGDKVSDGTSIFEIVDRGPNYVTVVNESGDISKKWLDAIHKVKIKEDVTSGYAPDEVSFKGYTTSNLHHSADATKSFQSTIERYNKGEIADAVAVLNALKATDAYMKINDVHLEDSVAPEKDEVKSWHIAHDKARDSLNRIGEFMHHFDYWHAHEHEIQDMLTNYTPDSPAVEMADSYEIKDDMIQEELTDKTIKSGDKIKVARMIADVLGVENAETMSPETAVNAGLRKIKNKRLTPDLIAVVKKMLNLAQDVGVKVDMALVPKVFTEETSTERQKRLSDRLEQDYKNKTGQFKGWDDKPKITSHYDADPWMEKSSKKKKVSEELEEAHKIGSKVEVVKGSGKGIVGHIGEIRHGAFKGAAKTYTVFHGDKGAIQVSKEHIRAIKEETLDELSTDLLARYKKKAGEYASASDKAAEISHKAGEHEMGKRWTQRANKKFSGIMKATNKQFDNDLKKEEFISNILEAIGNAKIMGKDVEDLKRQLSVARNLDIEEPMDKGVGHTMTSPEQSDSVRKMKIKYVHEGLLSKISGKIMGAAPEKPKYKVGQEVSYQMQPGQADGAGRGKIEKYSNGHYLINGKPVNHHEITKVHEEVDQTKEASKDTDKATLLAKQAKEKEQLIAKQQSERDRLKESADEDEDYDDLDEIADEDLDDMVDDIDDEDDILDAYEDDELALIDDETGEHVDDLKEETLNEVLSRMERIKAKARFARSSAKRERKIKIALKTHSSMTVINGRARKLAIKLLKTRLAKKPLDKLSIGEKERIEKVIQKRKTLINRLAMKLAPRVRKIENTRLAHHTYTK